MPPKNIKSFDLSLLVTEQGQAYQIFAYSDCLGEKCTARLPASIVKQLVPLAEKLQQDPLTPKELQDFGSRLFEALIRDDVRDMYRILEGKNVDGLSFQLALNLEPHNLQRLPWECMFDPYRAAYLSLRDNIHIIRKVQRKPEVVTGKAQGYTNLVIAIANARGQPPLNPQREHDRIEMAVGDLHKQGLLNRRYIQGSQAEIRQALSQVPNVFHFVGHGSIEKDIPGLYLEDSQGDAVFVPVSKLENEYFTPPPEIDRRMSLVILSACQTSETPKTEGYNSLAYQLTSKVDTVLAMQYPIGLDNLTVFNAELYRSLANGVPLETAVNAARRKIISDKPGGARDWISPVLVTHQDTPSKLLLLVSQNPFKGPIHYDLPDRERFFGRENELLKLGELYQKQKVVVIRGDTGCGKTSLLKAGWMPQLISAGQPLVYVSLSEDLEAQLRLEINKVLTQEERKPLPEGELDQLTAHFPKDLAIILDRVEQVELLSEQIDRIVTALIQWAIDPAQGRGRSHLVIATRLNERGEEPGLLQQLLSEEEYPRLDLDMLEYDQAKLSIEATTRKTGMIFLPETIQNILKGLKYNLPEERNMTALQVVCRAVYQHALDLQRDELTPELLKDLNDVDGILDQEFKIASKLKQSFYKGGEAARKVLAQFVGSDKKRMRPRGWQELLLRCGMEERELSQILDMLQIDGLVRLEQQHGEEKYELVHETLTRQIDWLSEDDAGLRELEEIVESTQTLIPLKSKKGGLEKLDARRDKLTLSSEQQELVLRSALEAGHETDYWFQRIQEPQLALSVLSSEYLSTAAQERACHYLGSMGSQQGEPATQAKIKLWEWARDSESPPRLTRAASLALAPHVDEAFIKEKFGAGHQDLEPGKLAALAIMHDAHPLPLKGLALPARRQIHQKILKDNSVELLSSVLRAASLGAIGFGLAVAWVYSKSYICPTEKFWPGSPVFFLELSLVVLLTFIIALPGALCAPLGRDLYSLLSGGRRRLPAALGAILGSALGIGLTVVFMAALAEYDDQPSLPRLIGYFISAAVWGAAIALPWLLSARFKLDKRTWVVVLLAGLCGALVFLGVTSLDNWWPSTSYTLTMDNSCSPGLRMVPGFLIGLGSAIGMVWGHLRERS